MYRCTFPNHAITRCRRTGRGQRLINICEKSNNVSKSQFDLEPGSVFYRCHKNIYLLYTSTSVFILLLAFWTWFVKCFLYFRIRRSFKKDTAESILSQTAPNRVAQSENAPFLAYPIEGFSLQFRQGFHREVQLLHQALSAFPDGFFDSFHRQIAVDYLKDIPVPAWTRLFCRSRWHFEYSTLWELGTYQLWQMVCIASGIHCPRRAYKREHVMLLNIIRLHKYSIFCIAARVYSSLWRLNPISVLRIKFLSSR